MFRDSAGQDDYAKLRPLGYADADVFLLCYSIADKVTYKSVDLKVNKYNNLNRKNTSSGGK